MSLIYGSNKIAGSRGINSTDHIQDDRVIRILRFDQIDDSALLNCNTKLFRLIVDIYEKQVIQEQVLDKTAGMHINLIIVLDHENISQFIIIINREQTIAFIQVLLRYAGNLQLF